MIVCYEPICSPQINQVSQGSHSLSIFDNEGNFKQAKQRGIGRETILKLLCSNWKQSWVFGPLDLCRLFFASLLPGGFKLLQLQQVQLLFAQIILGDLDILFEELAAWIVRNTHVRCIGISTLIDQFRRPHAKTGGHLAFYPIADRNDHVEIIEIQLTANIPLPFPANRQEFLMSCLPFQFTFIINVLNMLTYVLLSGLKKFRHQ